MNTRFCLPRLFVGFRFSVRRGAISSTPFIMNLAIALILAASLIAPLAAVQPAAASPICEPGFIYDVATGECVPHGSTSEFPLVAAQIPDEVIDDFVQPSASPSPSNNPVVNPDVLDDDPVIALPDDLEPSPSPELGEPPAATAIYLRKHNCEDLHVDPYSLSFHDLALLCQGSGDGIQFGIEALNLVFQDTVFIAGGIASFLLIPVDSYAIYEVLPDGYGTPIVYCAYTYSDMNQTAYAQQTIVNDAMIYVDLPAGSFVECDWFNVGDVEDDRIDVVKWECPPGLDTTGFTFLDYQTNCVQHQDGVEFFLAGPNDFNDVQTTGSNGPGAVEWNASVFQPVAPAILTVAEGIPAGYGQPVVYCIETLTVHNEHEPTSSQTLNQKIVSVTGQFELLYPGTANNEVWHIICHVFNIHDDHDGGDVTIFKYWCPEGVNPAELSQEDLFVLCAQSGDPSVEFTVTDADGAETLATDALGQVTFTNVGPGEFNINENVPAGYGQPWIFCGWGVIIPGDPGLAIDGFVPGQFMPVDGIDVDIPYPGFVMGCYVFNVIDRDDVIIIKYVCPEGIEREGGILEEYLELCTQHLDGVDFTLSGYDLSEQTGTVDGGVVVFGQLSDGEWTVVEHLPNGYGQPVIFCYLGDGSPLPFDPAGDAGYPGITFEYQGYPIICYWFNIPEWETSLTVEKRTCPAEYVGTDFLDYLVNCPQTTDGVLFSVEPGGGGIAQTRASGADGPGVAHFPNLTPAVEYWLSEDVPAGTVSIVISCAVGFGGIELPTMVIDQNTIALTLPANDPVRCFVFNIPGKEHKKDDGKLTIHKYWCEGIVYSPATCVKDTGGVKFQLDQFNGAGAHLLTTGASGSVSIILPDGSVWDVTEVGQAWCKAESNAVDAQGRVVIKKNQESVLTVYNCGKPPGEKRPEVTRFPNTGAGVATGSVLAAGVSAGAALSGVALLVLAALSGVGAAAVAARASRRR